MTLNYGLFDVSDPQNPDRVYSAVLLSRIIAKHLRDGIVHGDGDELIVTASDPPAMTVLVATGTAMVQGRFCENDEAVVLTVEPADTTYARIDRVVVRLSATPGRVIDILVKKGTAAPTPVAPALTRTPETWEMSLAQISVAAGATMVQAGNLTDERGDATLCGRACAAYLPSSQLEVTGPVNMQGKALTGLPAPSAGTDAARRDMGGATLQNLGAPVNANDAARKAYVDGKVASFGISDINVNAPKNWGNQPVTNMKSLQVNEGITAASLMSGQVLLKPFAAGDVSLSVNRSGVISETVMTVTVPAAYIAGSKIGYSGTLSVHGDEDYSKTGSCVIKVNNVTQYTHTVTAMRPNPGNDISISGLVNIKGGDVLTVTLSATGGSDQYPGKAGLNATFYGMNVTPAHPNPAWS